MREVSEMSDEERRNHPDMETLAALAAGTVEDEEAARHLESCPECRMEIIRLRRFERLSEDGDLVNEADWSVAKPMLDRAFREKVLPEIVRPADDTPRPREPFWTRWQVRWLAPVAAVAAVLLLVFISGRIERPGTVTEDVGPVRGAPVDAPDITLEKPAGEIAAPPYAFEWKPQTKEDYYTIEIFSSHLDRIFEVTPITGTRWVASDSLKSILQKDTVYLWSVTGHRGVEPVTVSPNAWFKISDPKD
ncbi:MAG: hypothetical protein PVF33_01980 [Candidatus Latescibacterota bacterium]|jgi:hypothetical protein